MVIHCMRQPVTGKPGCLGTAFRKLSSNQQAWRTTLGCFVRVRCCGNNPRYAAALKHLLLTKTGTQQEDVGREALRGRSGARPHLVKAKRQPPAFVSQQERILKSRSSGRRHSAYRRPAWQRIAAKDTRLLNSLHGRHSVHYESAVVALTGSEQGRDLGVRRRARTGRSGPCHARPAGSRGAV